MFPIEAKWQLVRLGSAQKIMSSGWEAYLIKYSWLVWPIN